MYKCGNKTMKNIICRVTNIKINEKMNASEFEGLQYKMLSEEPFKN